MLIYTSVRGMPGHEGRGHKDQEGALEFLFPGIAKDIGGTGCFVIRLYCEIGRAHV